MIKSQMCLRFTFIVVMLLLMFAASSFAQDANGSLRGQVTDPSGAAISGANVIMTPANGPPVVVQSNAAGNVRVQKLFQPANTRSRLPPPGSHFTKTTT